MNRVTIKIKDCLLEIDYTDTVLDQIRARYGLPFDKTIEPELLKEFFQQEISVALDKVDFKQSLTTTVVDI